MRLPRIPYIHTGKRLVNAWAYHSLTNGKTVKEYISGHYIHPGESVDKLTDVFDDEIVGIHRFCEHDEPSTDVVSGIVPKTWWRREYRIWAAPVSQICSTTLVYKVHRVTRWEQKKKDRAAVKRRAEKLPELQQNPYYVQLSEAIALSGTPEKFEMMEDIVGALVVGSLSGSVAPDEKRAWIAVHHATHETPDRPWSVVHYDLRPGKQYQGTENFETPEGALDYMLKCAELSEL